MTDSGKDDSYSTPSITIPNEVGDTVDLYFKIRGLKPKGFFSNVLCRFSKSGHPEQLMKNGTFMEWEISPTKLRYVLRVRIPRSEAGAKRHAQSDPGHDGSLDFITETFRSAINEFPCPVITDATKYDVKEARNGSFFVIRLKKQNVRPSWQSYLREYGTLDASGDDDLPDADNTSGPAPQPNLAGAMGSIKKKEDDARGIANRISPGKGESPVTVPSAPLEPLDYTEDRNKLGGKGALLPVKEGSHECNQLPISKQENKGVAYNNHGDLSPAGHHPHSPAKDDFMRANAEVRERMALNNSSMVVDSVRLAGEVKDSVERHHVAGGHYMMTHGGV